MCRIIGIDPGVTGAAAAFEVGEGDIFGPIGKQRVIDIIDLPVVVFGAYKTVDVLELRRFLKAHHADEVWMEAVHSMPRDGHVGACNFGDVRGSIRSTILLTGNTLQFVAPNVWKRAAGLLKSGDQVDKNAGRKLCQAKWKDSRPYLKRVMDHNRAEALLIAVYGANQVLNAKRVKAWSKRSG
jgi:hypothetical protein